jgi:hypothetical protein
MKYDPMPHQIDAYNACKKFNNRILLAHFCGTGKTDWGVWIYRNLKHLNEYLTTNVMHRVTLDEVDKYMPKLVFQNYDVDSSKDAEKLKNLLISKIGYI